MNFLNLINCVNISENIPESIDNHQNPITSYYVFNKSKSKANNARDSVSFDNNKIELKNINIKNDKDSTNLNQSDDEDIILLNEHPSNLEKTKIIPHKKTEYIVFEISEYKRLKKIFTWTIGGALLFFLTLFILLLIYVLNKLVH
ncbi:hypothetical protein A0H76_2695 [Hepatospora eriocheir]|uniref:Uncharacterized protein n=1 Tax=Hepatospora eriocheir TaxID=1081669 RepID=A0A1X0QLI2_9MICR|nr:hypothetical protein A0H76_2695 [Hepatospora eriocheir]